jgi:peptidoglycan/xylan/chitin deacetylase (PgdA/CDA1 family)
VAKLAQVIRHTFAPVHAPFAASLDLPRTLEPARESGAVALTFDDGPHPDGTPRVLEILAQHGASATFFVVGEQVVRRPELVRRIADEGHSVQLHGYRHRLQLRLTARQLRDDIERGIGVVEDALGASPSLHRPPLGVYSPAGLLIVRGHGLQPLLWARWGKDWRKFTTPSRIARRVLTGLRAGDVILLHDADFYSSKRSHERTADALELILMDLRSREIDTVRAV